MYKCSATHHHPDRVPAAAAGVVPLVTLSSPRLGVPYLRGLAPGMSDTSLVEVRLANPLGVKFEGVLAGDRPGLSLPRALVGVTE